MTVTVGAAPGVDRAAVDQQFTEIYAECFNRLARYIRFRNTGSLASLAEDFAQETCIELYWKMLKGEKFDHAYGILCFLSRAVVGRYLRLKRNTEFKVRDLTDPVNTPLIATGHAYAPETPELAETAAALDAAMDVMHQASQVWRAAHQEKYKIRRALLADEQGVTVIPIEKRASKQQKLAAVTAAEPLKLARFQEACRRVGVLRGELEQAGGANYRSSAGMPASAASAGSTKSGSVTSDPSVTHCPDGHLLDLDNTYFGENGRRRCRTCLDVQVKRSQTKRGQRAGSRPDRGYGRGTIAPELIEQARQMLLNTDNGMSIEAVGRAIGVSTAVFYKRLPDVLAERRKRLALVSA